MTEASIVIVTYGQWSLTEQCLRSLVAALGDKLGDTWEIVVVDNNSPDDTPDRLREWSDRVRVELLSQNRNFAGGCNVGAALASGEVLFFLNNDTEVPAHALETLVEQVHEPGVAAAGCRLLFPNGTVQHAGVAFIRGAAYGRAAFGQHVFHHQDQELAVTQACYETDCVTAACVAVRADVFQELGGFDERYLNGLEDVDLCLKIRTAGHLIVYRGDVSIIHHEGASRGKGNAAWDTPEKTAAFLSNDRLFVSRWAAHLDQDDELAARVWDACLQDKPPERSPSVTSLAVFGQANGLGPAADEARSLLRRFAELGLRPAAYNYPGVTVTPRLQREMRQLVDRSQTLAVLKGAPVVYVPAGAHDNMSSLVVGESAVFRLAQAQTALPLESARSVWATTPAVRAELIESGLSPSMIHVVPPFVPAAPLGQGGDGVLAVVPVHEPKLAAAVLEALSQLPPTTPVRLLPTTFVRGWEAEAVEQLPHAELLGPCSDEARFTRMSADADVVLCTDPSDRFERRALVAASVGTTPITLDSTGPAASALGDEVACTPATLAKALTARLRDPRSRPELALRVTALRDALPAADISAVGDALAAANMFLGTTEGTQ
jgi:GT2 family glycosyltransferase